MTALYRKYRPLDFDEVVGQEAVTRTLRNAIERDQVRQAYLFAGPRGTGKTSLARIVAKALNCEQGPTPTPCKACHSCRTIAAGTSLDVIEMDAASQRGIDDVREIRERVVLQPVEGRFKVYILDEAHQLTDAAFNALLKLIEEPPPHLVFIFCTTDVGKMLATVRSRCQTFLFQRPRLAELTRLLRRVADGEGIDTPEAALALIARNARGSFRDAVSTLDQITSATGGIVTVAAVLELLGSVEEEALFRICDLVVDHDTAGVLTFIEELAEKGQDLGRLVTELLEHLRQLLLVQHMGEAPDSLAVTEETRERLQAQANQLRPGEVVRLIDLLALAVDEIREGGDPRLPLELALVKVTRPQTDPSREALVLRLEQLEARPRPPAPAPEAAPRAEAKPAAPPEPERESDTETEGPPPLELDQIREQWRQVILPAVQDRSIPIATMLAEAQPLELAGNRLVIEFPHFASFHRNLAEEPKNTAILAEVLLEVTGRRLAPAFVVGEPSGDEEHLEAEHEPASEEDIVSLLKNTFDAREVEEHS